MAGRALEHLLQYGQPAVRCDLTIKCILGIRIEWTVWAFHFVVIKCLDQGRRIFPKQRRGARCSTGSPAVRCGVRCSDLLFRSFGPNFEYCFGSGLVAQVVAGRTLQYGQPTVRCGVRCVGLRSCMRDGGLLHSPCIACFWAMRNSSSHMCVCEDAICMAQRRAMHAKWRAGGEGGLARARAWTALLHCRRGRMGVQHACAS